MDKLCIQCATSGLDYKIRRSNINLIYNGAGQPRKKKWGFYLVGRKEGGKTQ